MKTFQNNGLLMIDGTYRLFKNNYVLIVLGTSDAVHKVHPICFSLTTVENEYSYMHILNSVQKIYQEKF